MPVFDFRNPTPAHGEARDQFELFAREFLQLIGLTIIVGPDRADAGRDLVVEKEEPVLPAKHVSNGWLAVNIRPLAPRCLQGTKLTSTIAFEHMVVTAFWASTRPSQAKL